MKDAIHPKLNHVIFVDTGANAEFVTRSTLSSKNTRDIDGVSHFVVSVDISSASHPFYTGKQRALQAEGRVQRFNKKYNLATTPTPE
jgi:large subunit ribosomal protein L31